MDASLPLSQAQLAAQPIAPASHTAWTYVYYALTLAERTNHAQ